MKQARAIKKAAKTSREYLRRLGKWDESWNYFDGYSATDRLVEEVSQAEVDGDIPETLGEYPWRANLRVLFRAARGLIEKRGRN